MTAEEEILQVSSKIDEEDESDNKPLQESIIFLNAIQLLNDASDEISPKTVINCFKKAKLITYDDFIYIFFVIDIKQQSLTWKKFQYIDDVD